MDRNSSSPRIADFFIIVSWWISLLVKYTELVSRRGFSQPVISSDRRNTNFTFRKLSETASLTWGEQLGSFLKLLFG
jgi:hypothetical protein